MPASSLTPRQKLIKQLKALLGDNMIEVELNLDDYNTAIDITLERYKQRADNSVEESIAFLKLNKDQQDYTLPEEVTEVRKIFRRGLTTAAETSVGSQYDPFDIAFTNIYLLQSGGRYGLLTWELYNQFSETAGKLFGSEYNFTFDTRTKKLTIIRHQRAEEEAILWLYNRVPEESLIQGTYSGPWIRSYALAQCKMMLGQAYEKFSTLPGPQGGTTLNGSQLKSEAQTELVELEEQLRNYQDGSNPLGFIIG